MRLSDVVNLPIEPASLEQIKGYLDQTRTHTEYQAAYARYFDIALELDLFQLVFDEGELVLKDIIHQSQTAYQEQILGSMITAGLALEKHDQVKALIEMRQQTLPVLKSYLATLDLIRYKKSLNLPVLEDLMKVLDDQIPESIRIDCLSEMAALYQADHQYDMALNCIHELHQFDLEEVFLKEELHLLDLLKRYKDVKKIALETLRKKTFVSYAVNALLSVYLKEEDFQKAQNLDADYEVLMEQADEADRKRFYQLMIDLYEKLGNKLSLELYQKKLKSLVKAVDRKQKNKTDHPEKPVLVIAPPERKAFRRAHLAEHFELANALMTFERTLLERPLFRDYLRDLFMFVAKRIEMHDVVLYLKEASPNFFNYKKERLYDKTVVPEWIEGTVIEKVLEAKDDIFEYAQTIRYKKDVITQKDYADDIRFIYAYHLQGHGVLVILLAEELSDAGAYYDIFKLLSNLILSHLLLEEHTKRLKTDIRYYEEIFQSPLLAYRDMTETFSTYNHHAQKMLGVEAHTHIELFIKDIAYDHVRKVKDTVDRLFQSAGQSSAITYQRQNKTIVESMISLRVNDDIHIVSLFEDQTKDVEKVKSLITMATTDDETGLFNMHALNNMIEEHLEDKATLFMIEFDRSLKHIYGMKRMSQFFKEFAQVTKKFFSDGTAYRSDFSTLIVILPQNDVRSVTKRVKAYLKHLETHQSKVLAFEKFACQIGILRYPVATSDKRLEQLLSYLEIALERAKQSSDEPFVFFVYRDYEDDVFEQQVIDQLNLAIETKNVGLSFKQLTDIESNKIWHYESTLSLANLEVDSKYLSVIARKRHRTKDLEHFHIDRVLSYLQSLEQKTGRLVKLTIPVSKETFLDPKFNPYVIERLKTYSIPAAFIRLKLEATLRPSLYATQLSELSDYGIAVDTTSLETALSYPVCALHLDLPRPTDKQHGYLKMVKTMLLSFEIDLVIRNVMNRDQKEALKQLGITLIEGPIYKTLSETVLTDKVKGALTHA